MVSSLPSPVSLLHWHNHAILVFSFYQLIDFVNGRAITRGYEFCRKMDDL
jgi:hypothetical protein